MGFMDSLRGWLSGFPATGEMGLKPGPSATYMRGNRGVTFTNWRPALRESQDEISESWDIAASRVVDVVHNSGWLSGAIDQAVANTVGTGLRLKALPENSLFGLDNDEVHEWARMVEARFELWARTAQECDIEGRRTFGQMQAVAFRSWFATGEILGEILWRQRPWNSWGTKVRLLPPHRISRRTDRTQRLVNGVYHDTDGMPIGYRAVKYNPLTDIYVGYVEYDVAARDRLGRPKVIFVFDGAPGTCRGLSPMVPALQVARQFDQLADATLTASIMQTLFAATITSDEPTQEVMQGLLTPQEQARMAANGMSPVDAYLEMVGGYYDNVTINPGVNGRIAHLFPGQKLDFHNATTPTADYKTFSTHLLRELARCLGLTFESATGDYAGATYSSVRMATGEMHAITKARRQNVIAPFCQPIYEAWLEESVEKGEIPFPGGYAAFLANRAAACRAEWRGSPKPQADDVKTAQAHEIWRRLGVMSDAMIANDLGVDIEDVYAQRAAESSLRKEYGLTDPMTMPANGGAPVPADGAIEQDDTAEQDDSAEQEDPAEDSGAIDETEAMEAAIVDHH